MDIYFHLLLRGHFKGDKIEKNDRLKV